MISQTDFDHIAPWNDFAAWVFLIAAVHFLLTGLAKATAESSGDFTKRFGKTLEPVSLIVTGLTGLFFFHAWVVQYQNGVHYFLKVALVGLLAIAIGLVATAIQFFSSEIRGERQTEAITEQQPPNPIALYCTWIEVPKAGTPTHPRSRIPGHGEMVQRS
ncbi:hypothetical protein DFJ75_3491 [Williamsia muralis]|uniref:Uncharacterized protein n=1 Tax=Williamsia marianensis TaxID=85044 RepID=A0A495K7N8_WILMA|nr:hypothetical protein [Williamsia muralis]RKR96638.1 hypothetical protein DFJ75_3491 [Williamsia muralis]